MRRLIAFLSLCMMICTVLACTACVPNSKYCPNLNPQSWWGSVERTELSFSALGKDVPATVFKPHDSVAYPGPRPAVIVLHGYWGPNNEFRDQCYQWWAAWSLAGHGFVTVVPTTQDMDRAGVVAAALDWLASADNPYRDITDNNHVGLVGHSAAAWAASQIQQSQPRIKAVVEYDNLVKNSQGYDRSNHGLMPNGCYDDPTQPHFTPVVPAMGLASDQACFVASYTPYVFPDGIAAHANLKTSGYDWWKAAGKPAAQIVVSGIQHQDFEQGGNDALQQQVSYATRAWLDRWLGGDTTALQRLSATDWGGTARANVLSTQFQSAVSSTEYSCDNLWTC